MHEIDLSKFCAPKSDPREYLHAPFLYGGRTLAVSGRILIQLDAATDAQNTVDVDQKLPKLAELIERVNAARLIAGGWTDIDTVGVSTEKCKTCRGIGRVKIEACDDCDGAGEFDHGQHTYDCKECDGAGQVIEPSKDGSRCACCAGFGFSGDNSSSTFGSPRLSVSSLFIRMIRELPSAQIRGPVDDGFLYRFDGGIGFVAPLYVNPIARTESDRPEAP